MIDSLDTPVSVLDVTCPKCGVGRGLLCLVADDADAGWRSTPHKVRLDMADRAEASRRALQDGSFS